MTEAVIEREWVEIDPAEARAAGPLMKPKISSDSERTIRPGASRDGNTCRCWRCKGGNISVAERAAYDRILARYLVRLSEAEREDWLWEWGSVPTHGPDDIRTLTAWMEIERGKQIPHPQYLPRRVG